MKTRLLTAAFVCCAGLAHAKLVKKDVPYEHAGTKLEGFLVYDDAKVSLNKKAPGVLVFPEWWGLTAFPKVKAEEIAKLGYVAFAVDMYGAGIVTDEPAKAGELAGQFYGKPLMAERARAGLEQLMKTTLVQDDKVAAVGFCFGGAVCQALAYNGAPLAGIVSFHGSLIPASAEAAQANKARFLILHGAVDPFIKPEEVTAFVKSMESGKFDYQFVSYGGAIHAFTNPGADRIAREKGLAGVGYNLPAAQRSWEHMRVFFKEIFATR